MKRLLWSAPVICLFIACSVNLSEPEGRACDSTHECGPGLVCQGGTCVDELVDPGSDSGSPGSDSGVDGGTDSGTDGGGNSGTDGGPNPIPDGGYPPNTFFVDPAGNDNADGRSPATAWQTVAKVNAATFPAGAWVLFKGGGVWNESLTVKGSGTDGSPIVYGAYGTGRPVLDCTGFTGVSPSPNSVINANSKSFIEFHGFELRNCRNNTQLVYMGNTHDVVFDDLYLHDADKGFHATPSAASTNITIRNSIVEKISSGGGYVHAVGIPASGAGWIISDSQFSNIEQSCISDAADGTVFERNTIYNCGKITTSTDKHGILLKGSNTVLTGNLIYDVAGSGIEWADAPTPLTGTLVARRNRIWDAAVGINIGTASSHVFHLSNNSILTNRVSGTSTAGVVVKANTEVVLENNLATGGAVSALSVSRTNTTGYVDRKNVWNSTSGSTPVLWNSSAMTIAQYATASASTSTDVDPKLTSASATAPDFRLMSTSPVLNFGVKDPATGNLTPGCDGAVNQYCGSAPEPGALELIQ